MASGRVCSGLGELARASQRFIVVSALPVFSLVWFGLIQSIPRCICMSYQKQLQNHPRPQTEPPQFAPCVHSTVAPSPPAQHPTRTPLDLRLHSQTVHYLPSRRRPAQSTRVRRTAGSARWIRPVQQGWHYSGLHAINGSTGLPSPSEDRFLACWRRLSR